MQRVTLRVSYELRVLAPSERAAISYAENSVEIPDEDVRPEDEITGIEEYVEGSFEIDVLKKEEVELPEEPEVDEKQPLQDMGYDEEQHLDIDEDLQTESERLGIEEGSNE